MERITQQKETYKCTITISRIWKCITECNIAMYKNIRNKCQEFQLDADFKIQLTKYSDALINVQYLF